MPPSATTVPADSFLGAYAAKGAFTDCYAASVPGSVSLSEFVLAFYTTPLFKVERWLLAKLGGLRKEATTTRDGAAHALADALKQAAEAKAALGRVEASHDGDDPLVRFRDALVKAQNARGDAAPARFPSSDIRRSFAGCPSIGPLAASSRVGSLDQVAAGR